MGVKRVYATDSHSQPILRSGHSSQPAAQNTYMYLSDTLGSADCVPVCQHKYTCFR